MVVYGYTPVESEEEAGGGDAPPSLFRKTYLEAALPRAAATLWV